MLVCWVAPGGWCVLWVGGSLYSFRCTEGRVLLLLLCRWLGGVDAWIGSIVFAWLALRLVVLHLRGRTTFLRCGLWPFYGTLWFAGPASYAEKLAEIYSQCNE
ncbi:hypothetical protein CHARACLAT_001782 [Characodon lateralis]|uniref:Uncharacterized protein n=1 Tax=Characodon lateralis TaxID=208331 RepID=A0ABU7DN05_9TELE|nr:hypothetical protein [Characodon lateralis]